jgi:peptidoglycan hydrolase CwlO-like protein
MNCLFTWQVSSTILTARSALAGRSKVGEFPTPSKFLERTKPMDIERVKELLDDIQAKMGELEDTVQDINDKIDEVYNEIGAT